MLRRRSSSTWLCAAIALAPLTARAQVGDSSSANTTTATATARAAYRSGAAAYDSGNYVTACPAFSEADAYVT